MIKALKLDSSGKPLYLSNDRATRESSMFRVMGAEEFTIADELKLQGIYKSQHIVITGKSLPDHKFDVQSMRRICNPADRIVLQGKCSNKYLYVFELI